MNVGLKMRIRHLESGSSRRPIELYSLKRKGLLEKKKKEALVNYIGVYHEIREDLAQLSIRYSDQALLWL